MELSTLQAAVRCEVHPQTIRSWIEAGSMRPCGYRGKHPVFSETEVDRMRGIVQRPAPVDEPILRLVEEPNDPVLLPTGLATLERIGRFEPAPWAARSLGGAQMLGKVRFGEDWLRVYRSWSGVVYHEQAEWMEDDPDWMDTPEHAETYALLEMAA